VEDTSSYVGLVAGILADLGFDPVVVACVADDAPIPPVVVWVTGDETTPDEVTWLTAIDARGLAIGAGVCPDGWVRSIPKVTKKISI
jgi:hypothetical protein